MSNELLPGDVRALWQGQESEPLQLSLEELRRKASRFQQKVRRRNARLYIGYLVLIILCGWRAWTAEAVLVRIGCGLAIAGALNLLRHMRARGAARPLPLDAVTSSYVAFHRRELERQRDRLLTVWQWAGGSMVPGFLVLMTHNAIEAAAKGPGHLLRFGIVAVICILALFGAAKLNKIFARKLEAEIRALEP